MSRSVALPQRYPDPIRIAAISASIALNAMLFAFLMQPQRFTVAADPEEAAPRFVQPFIKPKEQVVEEQIQKKVEPLPVVQQHRQVARRVERQTVINDDSTRAADQPVDDQQQQKQDVVDDDSGKTGDTSKPIPSIGLVPIIAPPPAYPPRLMADGTTGTVLLELLVGIDGRVLEVRVVHSSGNRQLDTAAREQVLRNWRFQPAMENGVAVQALGRLPVVFRLDAQ